MKQLYMKQKMFSLSGKFSVTDAAQQDVYFVEGSFLQVPKTFTIFDKKRHEVAHITKKVLSLLPKFFVEVDGREILTIKKELSFFKGRYTIEHAAIEMRGDWWDMDFSVYHQNQLIGAVRKKWLSWGDQYEVTVHEETFETILIALVVAIDCVKSSEAAAASS